MPLALRSEVDPLIVQPGVDVVCADGTGVTAAPERDEPPVIVMPTQGTRPVPGCDRRRLVQEEQLGETTRLQHRPALPPTELKPTRDPPAHRVSATDRAVGVVQAPAISVHQPSGGVGDQIA
jgi:hypothetical protein